MGLYNPIQAYGQTSLYKELFVIVWRPRKFKIIILQFSLTLIPLFPCVADDDEADASESISTKVVSYER